MGTRGVYQGDGSGGFFESGELQTMPAFYLTKQHTGVSIAEGCIQLYVNRAD
jgi:hypothetical protein